MLRRPRASRLASLRPQGHGNPILLTPRPRAGITKMATATRSRAERVRLADIPCGAGPTLEVGTAVLPWSGTPRAERRSVQAARGVAQDNTGRYQKTLRPSPQAPSGPCGTGHRARPRISGWDRRRVPRCLARERAEGHRLGQPRSPPSPGGRTRTRPAASLCQAQRTARCCEKRTAPVRPNPNRSRAIYTYGV